METLNDKPLKKFYVKRTIVEEWWLECASKDEALKSVRDNNDPTKAYIKSITIKPIKS
jgi:hypothetical protein